MREVPDAEIKKYQLLTLNSGSRVAVVATMEEVAHFNRLNVASQTLRVCHETILTAHVAMFLQKNSYLKDALDMKIRLLKSNGLINHWIAKFMDYKYLNVKQQSHGPEKLNFNQLLGAFQVWLYALCLSVCLFISELVIHTIRRKLLP